ncbi:hypothetical protein BLOT_014550 [Blomia tropicalis]|nr:hypothetical protein BLOT_014550 [Blomia tropicalis]
MKSIIIVSVFLVTLHSAIAAPKAITTKKPNLSTLSTTPGPIETTTWSFPLESERLQEIDRKLFGIEINASKLEMNYIHQIYLPEKSKGDQIIKNSSNIHSDLNEIKVELINIQSQMQNNIYEQFDIELALIRVRKLDKMLKTIRLELVGESQNVSEFPNYQFSEYIQVAFTVANSKFVDLFRTFVETKNLVDQLESLVKPPTPEEQKNILTDLYDILETTSNKTQPILMELLRERTTQMLIMHQLGEELNLIQKLYTEEVIDGLVLLESFIKKYQGSLERLYGRP